MEYKCIASGSKANCHILTDSDNQSIILDIGVSYKELCVNIDTFKGIIGCLVSHKHSDHTKGLADLEHRFVPIVSLEKLEVGQSITLGNYLIMVLPAYHDVQCCSFLIKNTHENKTIFFATDTKVLPQIAIKPYDLLLVEVNYDSETITKCTLENTIEHNGYVNHLSLAGFSEWLDKFGDIKHKNIIVHHLSHYHSNKELIKEVLSGYAENMYIAQSGLKIEF